MRNAAATRRVLSEPVTAAPDVWGADAVANTAVLLVIAVALRERWMASMRKACAAQASRVVVRRSRPPVILRYEAVFRRAPKPSRAVIGSATWALPSTTWASLPRIPRPPAPVPLHLAIRAAPGTFTAAIERLNERGIAFGNDPEDAANGRTDDPLGGAGRAYLGDPDGHLYELVAAPAPG